MCVCGGQGICQGTQGGSPQLDFMLVCWTSYLLPPISTPASLEPSHIVVSIYMHGVGQPGTGKELCPVYFSKYLLSAYCMLSPMSSLILEN